MGRQVVESSVIKVPVPGRGRECDVFIAEGSAEMLGGL